MGELLSERLQAMHDYGDFGSALEGFPELAKAIEQERDELAAQVEVMRGALMLHERLDYLQHSSMPIFPVFVQEVDAMRANALSITPSRSLREVKARTLEAEAELWTGSGIEISGQELRDELQEMAAAIRKGE